MTGINTDIILLNKQFEQALEDFTSGMCSLMYILPNIITPLANNGAKCMKKLVDDDHFSQILSSIKQGSIPDNSEKEQVEIIDIATHMKHTGRAMELSLRNHIVSSVSIFETLMAKLIRLLYIVNPQYLDKKKSVFSYDDIGKHSKEELHEKYIDYGVVVFMNLSKKEQFKKIGKILSEKIYGEYYTPLFAEVCERRHIFVHSDGRVTANYLKNCKDCNVKGIDSLNIGDTIITTQDYITNCFFTLLTTGVMIGQLVWRKCTTAKNIQADELLLDICVNSIQDKRPWVSLRLLLFALNKIGNNICKDYFPLIMLNLALSYNRIGKVEMCCNTLDSVEWENFEAKYQLAAHVLRGDFKTATSMMHSADLSEVDYCSMSIFEEFRQSEVFILEFEKMFGKKPEDCTPQLIQPFENTHTMNNVRQARQEMIKAYEILSSFMESNIES